MINRDLSVPIPGQSLTEDHSDRPYTQPPKMTDPEAVVQMYLQKLGSEEVMSAVTMQVENGMTIKDITTGLLRVGAAKGVHSLDVGLLVAPIVHEKIRGVADMVGLDYQDGFEDPEAVIEKNNMETKRVAELAKNNLRNPSPKPAPVEPPVEAPAPKGLIARRVK